MLALVALAGLVFAGGLSAHGGVATRIHGCINDSSGFVKIVDPDEECGMNFSPYDWSIGATYFAVLDEDGNIGAQSGGIELVHHSEEGVTRLSFPDPITNCAVSATIGNPVSDSVSARDVSGEIL